MPNSSAAAAASDDTSSGGSNGSNGGGAGGGGGSVTLKKGPWTAAEDAILIEYVKKFGEGNWNAVQKNSGLQRCGKSCRLRWANHLRPNLKKGSFSPEEERLILELHAKLGNKWARMAAQLPGRTDNEIKNYWNTRVKRRQRAGLPLYPQDIQKHSSTFNHNQTCPSQSPSSSSIPLSSQQPQSNFMAPLSMSDPMSFSTTSPLLGQQHNNNSPLLSSPILGFKRFRSNNMGYSRPFAPRMSPSLPPLSSSLYNNTNFSSQLLQPQNFQFDTNSYNFGPPTMLQSGFEPSGLIGPGSAFSIKTELPSSQMSQPGATALAPDEANDIKFCSSLASTNSGLLDALLQEAEAMGGKDQARQDGLMPFQNEKCGGFDEFLNNAHSVVRDTTPQQALGSGCQWDEAASTQSSAGGETNMAPTLNINNSVDDDELTSLLSSIPTTVMVSELYNESANRQSTVTDDNIGLDMEHLPSNSEFAAHCAWNNLPGMSC